VPGRSDAGVTLGVMKRLIMFLALIGLAAFAVKKVQSS
jgi:flagellar biogenesis protein FliO